MSEIIAKGILPAAMAILIAAFSACGNKEQGKPQEGATVYEDSRAGGAGLKSDSGKPLLVDFSASWCQPCQMLKPEFAKAADKVGGKVEFRTVDVDENRNLAAEFGVQGVPTLVLISPDGKEIGRRVGYMDAEEIGEFALSAVRE